MSARGGFSKPAHVSIETLSKRLRVGAPYRGIETVRDVLRIRVRVAPRGHAPYEVVIDVDEVALAVQAPPSGAQDGAVIDLREIAALFVVERQPRHGFLPWFGVFARSRGRADRLVLETPELRVARFVERTLEDRLGLDDKPVRGALR